MKTDNEILKDKLLDYFNRIGIIKELKADYLVNECFMKINFPQNNEIQTL